MSIKKRFEYIDALEKENGTCDCPGLDALFRIKESTQKHLNYVKFLDNNFGQDDLIPRNLPFIIKYGSVLYEMSKAMNKYQEAIYESIEEGLLVMILYDDLTYVQKRIISLGDARKLRDPLITAHCRNCHQQISILD